MLTKSKSTIFERIDLIDAYIMLI